ncbi:hypothetical protein GCM10027176_58890 [Actinoallomurus bryophytorum]
MHMPIDRTVPSDLKVHFCHDALPQLQISSGDPSLALRALTLMQRPESALEIRRAEPAAALLAEPPEAPLPEELEEDEPRECRAGVPDLPA